MATKIKHPFKSICYDVNELLDGCATLNKFMRRLEKQANKYPARFDYNKYVGFGFEAFIECLIKLSPIDKRINIINYKPVTKGDMGVDGFGVGHDGKTHTVQCKYRSNVTTWLTANEDHVSNFHSHSHAKYKASHMTIFTTARGLNQVVAEQMFNNEVRTHGYEELKKLVDDNLSFWAEFKSALTR